MKNILLITYYFPPCGGAPVQRWLRFLPLLVQAGNKVSVLTTEDGDYPVLDPSLLEKIPPEVEVIRTSVPKLGKLWQKITGKNEALPYGKIEGGQHASFTKRLLIWLRLNLIAPDARIVWNPSAKKKALSLLRERGSDLIITTGPPHSTHLIGLYLKRKVKVKWLTDFRDPWTKIHYLQLEKQNPLIRKLNQFWERQVVSNADVNLIISKAIADSLPEGRKQVLYNGFDPSDFTDMHYAPASDFRIKYIGQLTAGQDIEPFLIFLSEQVQKYKITNINFTFVGNVKPEIKNYNFPVYYTGFVNHASAIEEMVNSELLILLINDTANNLGILTTKLFEYLASQTPIMCLGPVAGEAANVIVSSKAGKVFSGLNSEVWEYIKTLYQNWKHGEPVRNDYDCSLWSVQQQIKTLLQIIDNETIK